MKHTKLRTKSQLLHVDSSTTSHKRDKAAGDKRRSVQFVAVGAADRPSPERTFPGVTGIEVIYDESTRRWSVCGSKGEFGAHLVGESAARARFYAPTRRKGVVEIMARLDPNPLTNHTVSFHPAQSDLIADLTARGEGQDLPRKVMAQFIKRAMPLFAGRRYVIGAALHVDTSDLHVDVTVARNGRNGRLGDAGLGMTGPWMAAVDRQIACAKINNEKRSLYERAMANFQRREGAGAIPFDILLARAFDEAAASVLGSQLQPYVDRYAASVPNLEREQLLATLREVEAVRGKLLHTLTEIDRALLTHPLPAPASEVFAKPTGGARAEGAAAIYKTIRAPALATSSTSGAWSPDYEPVV